MIRTNKKIHMKSGLFNGMIPLNNPLFMCIFLLVLITSILLVPDKNIKDFNYYKLDSEINAHFFIFNERGDLSYYCIILVSNSTV